jgi:hypothetical protein
MRLSAIRTLPLQIAALAGHTVRIAHALPGLAGAAMVSWGAAMVYEPAGLIVGGAFMLLLDRQTAVMPWERRRPQQEQ